MAAPWFAALDGYKKKNKKNNRKEYDKEYEKTKRRRHFQPSWKTDRPWLKDTDQGMICEFCVESNFKNAFTTGCSLLKLDSVIKHEISDQHKRASAIYTNKRLPKASTPAAKVVESLNKATFDKLSIMFRTCHAIVMNNRPITDFNWICELDEVKGLEVEKTYRNNKSAALFVNAIAHSVNQEITKVITNCAFLCLIGDGSTDAAVKEQEMWFLRCCTLGTVNVYFIGVHNPDKASAENLVKGVRDILVKNLHIEWEDIVYKLVGLACDGASVMTGCRSGVGALLRHDVPHLLTIHCMVHRLELALKDLAKSNKMYQRTVDTMLLGLYLFYHNSSLNRAMLHRTFDALKTNDASMTLLLPTKVGGTRWISHTLRAVTNCLNTYSYIVAHLQQLTETTERVSSDAKSKAKAFLKLLRSRETVMFLLFMLDVLQPVKKLSVVLQNRTALLSSQHLQLTSTIAIIEKYKKTDGPNLRKLAENDGQFKNLIGGNGHFESAKQDMISKLLNALQKRFSEFSCRSVISATRIADIKSWPLSWESLKDYGDAELQTLVEHYKVAFLKACVNVEDAEYEWTALKKELLDLPSMITDWPTINQIMGSRFPNILKVMDLIMSLSPSSAEAERGFSQLKLMKNRLRTRMNQSTLNDLLSVKLEGPSIQNFDPTDAIHHWNQTGVKRRRPTLMESINERKMSECMKETVRVSERGERKEAECRNETENDRVEESAIESDGITVCDEERGQIETEKRDEIVEDHVERDYESETDTCSEMSEEEGLSERILEIEMEIA